MVDEDTTYTVRIGMVNFINTAPIYEPWKKHYSRSDWQIVEAAPARLNRLLAEGDLDLGFVSCYEYGKRPEMYRLLSDLSISANGPVGSVFLCSKLPADDLSGSLILLSNQSETSVALTKVVLEEFYGVRPRYLRGEIASAQTNGCDAVLAIGDDALRLAGEGTYQYMFDLGDIWKKHTGLPFVFAVCAVREQFVRQHPQTLAQIHASLLACRQEGGQDLAAICRLAAPRIPMAVSRCHAYLQGIEYDFDEQKQEALYRFFDLLITRGEIKPAALPLKLLHTAS